MRARIAHTMAIMTTPAEILDRIRALEAELEVQVHEKQRQWHYRIERRRVRFDRAVRDQHRALRENVLRYLRRSRVATLLSAPVIYSVFVPLVLADLWISGYQAICFPLYGIPKVRRTDYIAIDRWRLAYLNAIEKVNCDYCSYANGVLAYMREVTARTEQYWCPIKHARAVRGPHARQRLFADYGDARGYQRELIALRRALQDERTRTGRAAPPPAL